MPTLIKSQPRLTRYNYYIHVYRISGKHQEYGSNNYADSLKFAGRKFKENQVYKVKIHRVTKFDSDKGHQSVLMKEYV